MSTIGIHNNQSSLDRMKNYILISAYNFTPTNLEKGSKKIPSRGVLKSVLIMVYWVRCC